MPKLANSPLKLSGKLFRQVFWPSQPLDYASFAARVSIDGAKGFTLDTKIGFLGRRLEANLCWLLRGSKIVFDKLLKLLFRAPFRLGFNGLN